MCLKTDPGALTGSDSIPEYCRKPVLVLGCGNVLFGDDGFGPAVANHITASGNIPDTFCVLDAGTGSREILFNIVLSERRPEKLIIVDAMECGKEPGDVVELSLDSIPLCKSDDFSMHHIPTSNLLRELQDLCSVEVMIIVVQPASIPREVKPGLSVQVQNAVERAAQLIVSAGR